MEPAGARAATTADATAMFLVSLYLVLLAFFILLAVISTFDGQKSERVLQSVTSRLGPGPGWMPAVPDTGAGNAAALRSAGDLRRELREAFDAEVPGVRFGVRQSGRILEATMPTHMIFDEGTAVARGLAKGGIGLLMGRVARAVNAAVPAVRCKVEIVVRDGIQPPLTPHSLSVRRADLLARSLRAAGLAESEILAGAEAGERPEIRFVFRILAEPAAEGG
ncbi:hypothetical protein ABIE65_002619 [Constrictibacter sp. MBR-5]|jgi:hypothetical protein|uniref:hypothetical protein n=1 Tax=Constrictibacter sp. MBR-5 TaxID=3156467 RepID=UPI0033967126